MPTLIEAAAAAAGGFLCSAAQDAGDWFDFLETATEAVTGLTPLVNGPGIIANTAAAATCSNFGDGTPGGGGPAANFPPGITGGQCPGVPYVLSGTYVRTVFVPGFPDSVTTVPWSFASVTGPVQSVFIQQTSGARTIAAIDGDGNQVNMVSGTGSNQVWSDLSQTTAVPANSGPNDCGNVSGPPTGSGPLPYDDGVGGSPAPIVDYVARRPIIIQGGDIIVPVEINGPNFNIVANTNIIGGGVVIVAGGPAPIGGSNCCLPIADLLPPLVPLPDDPEPRNEVFVIKGLIVTITSFEETVKATRLANTDGPVTFIPRAGIVNFGMRIATQLVWSEDFPIKNRKQYFPVPDDQIAVDWSVEMEDGYTIEVTPVRVSEYTDE